MVPVGLTRYGKTHIKPVKKDNAAAIIETVINFRKRFKKRHGDPLVYIADELYLKAEMPFPALKEYGDLPQIENGVGMVPVFMHSAKKIKLPKKITPVKAATFTGASFMPHLEEFSIKLKTIEGLDLDIFKVENSFFGPTVTVAGLLTGKDILKAVVGKTKADCLLVPDVTLRSESDVFLDNVTIRELEESLGMRVRVIESSPEGLLRGIMDESKR
ncbi:MAG: DUF512 domain-containing protein [Nitrospirota bacterium]|nr:DUF512 domain-containing protein [Nitrospirota bacterium]